jgi:multiple RNA-binding domain-containing protein 1
MAVVEFTHPNEGRKAFRAVAYRRRGNSIIYLKKGPVGMFVEGEATLSTNAPMAVAGGKPVVIEDVSTGLDKQPL